MCGCLGERMCQGVKGSSVPAVERLISVTPSCQPAVSDVFISVCVCVVVWVNVCVRV